jgi:uncharacterized protein
MLINVLQPIAAPPPSPRVAAFHLMAKPIGPICNLDCKYCFYLEKEKLYPDTRQWKMSDAVLEAYVKQYIEQQNAPEINFAWQGGEPTLLGVDFFEKAVALQQRYANGKRIHNALQTNGTLLDDQWGAFLAEHQFLVGLSIDGPRQLHDFYRVDKQQKPTFDAVMRGLGFLKKHQVEFNTLTVVNRQNSQRPLEVYRFLKEIGSGFLQFIPLVERAAPTRLKVLGFELSDPPVLGQAGQFAAPEEASPVTSWSVDAHQYGRFLCDIFDHWVRHDVGRVFVQMFDVALGNWMGLGSPLCVFAEKCGNAMAIEHNGDVFSCDHYVYPGYKIGNLLSQSLGEMAASPQQRKFGADKSETLPDYCKKCEVRFACNGECPKHRFTTTPDGQAGLNYLCPAYKRFFNHIDPHMKTMAALLRAGRPPAAIMGMLAFAQRPAKARASAGRNDPCPCGSGLKFKKCCEKSP